LSFLEHPKIKIEKTRKVAKIFFIYPPFAERGFMS